MMWSWNELTGATNCLHVCEMPQLTANSKHFARVKNVESVAVNTDQTLVNIHKLIIEFCPYFPVCSDCIAPVSVNNLNEIEISVNAFL